MTVHGAPVDDGDVEEDHESIDEANEERDDACLSTHLIVNVPLHLSRRHAT